MASTAVLGLDNVAHLSGKEHRNLASNGSLPQTGTPLLAAVPCLPNTLLPGISTEDPAGWAAPCTLLSLPLIQLAPGPAQPLQASQRQPGTTQQLPGPSHGRGLAPAAGGHASQQQQLQKASLGRDSPSIHTPFGSGSWLDFLGTGLPPPPVPAVPGLPPPSHSHLPQSHLPQASLGIGPVPVGKPQPTGAAGTMDLYLQLQAVQGHVAQQQKFIRSLHKWASNAAAAVRQLQEQARSVNAPLKSCEAELAELRSQVAALSNHCASKDARIDALVQELSDIKAQLVEVEKLASDLAPDLKRRKLLSSESHNQTNPLTSQPQGAEALGALPGEPSEPREGASFSTDGIKDTAS